jgi:uncharacterized transporter YbjL
MGAGAQAGKGFVEVLAQNGPKLFFVGVAMTLVPMIIAFFVAAYLMKLELPNTLGSITGGMTSTPALGALIEVAGSDYVAAAYGCHISHRPDLRRSVVPVYRAVAVKTALKLESNMLFQKLT